MTIRTPNPCDGEVVIAPIIPIIPGFQGPAPPVISLGAPQEPIFSERVFSTQGFLGFKAERTITKDLQFSKEPSNLGFTPKTNEEEDEDKDPLKYNWEEEDLSIYN